MLTIASRIDVEKCTRAIGNGFEVVLVAAARARELKLQRNPLTKYPNSVSVQALRDIETGEVGRELLANSRSVAKKRK